MLPKHTLIALQTNLELIKEALTQVFDQLGNWIREAGIPPLKSWYEHLASRWQHVAAYYLAPTTSALSEGIKNVIKMVKRRAFSYRNMEYFKLKIMQVCGYLRSKMLENQASGT